MVQEVSLDELSLFAEQFWKYVGNAKVFAFHAPMGAGKTTLITALCKYKGVTDTMSSPTFSIINQYTFKDSNGDGVIYHIDLYRLKSIEEVVQTGVEDCIYSGDICMVEWPEKAPELFEEKDTIHISIEPLTETLRRIKIEKAFP